LVSVAGIVGGGKRRRNPKVFLCTNMKKRCLYLYAESPFSVLAVLADDEEVYYILKERRDFAVFGVAPATEFWERVGGIEEILENFSRSPLYIEIAIKELEYSNNTVDCSVEETARFEQTFFELLDFCFFEEGRNCPGVNLELT